MKIPKIMHVSASGPKPRVRMPGTWGIYSRFPVELCYYQPGKTVDLFDRVQFKARPHALAHESVTVAPDGLVYPTLSKKYNGAFMFRASAYRIVQRFQALYGDAIQRWRAGEAVETPRLRIVPNGTEIPKELTLVHEDHGVSCLQPSGGMRLVDFNHKLTQFFDKNASEDDPQPWLEHAVKVGEVNLLRAFYGTPNSN